MCTRPDPDACAMVLPYLIFESSVGLSTVIAAHVSATRIDIVLLTLSSQIVRPRHNMEAAYVFDSHWRSAVANNRSQMRMRPSCSGSHCSSALRLVSYRHPAEGHHQMAQKTDFLQLRGSCVALKM